MKPTDAIFSIRRARILFVLLAGIFLMPTLQAQPVATEPAVDSRYLFVFDTSSDMKKRVPSVQKALDQMLATSIGGQLHTGDSLGVWTFDQDLHAGKFQLMHWDAAHAALLASNIMEFIDKQHYGKKTSFDALQPSLNQVVRDSERLTVVIFCDGQTPMSVTPFDAGINKVFQERQAEQKKARQPFIVILRSQRGEYIGCTVSFPPAPLNLPQFPPLPLPPPPPAPQPTNVPPPAPVVPVPSLIIVGTKVTTSLPPPPTNAPEPVAPVEKTNVITAPPKISTVVTNTITRTNIVTQTNAVVASSENSAINRNGALAVGATLLAVAGTLMILILRRTRRKDSSLITRSMNDRR